MRLSSDQVAQLHSVLKLQFKEIPYKLFLYGSRAVDNLKGGDIDLLIIAEQAGVDFFLNHELEILVQIKKQPAIGQRRIDIKAATEDAFKSEPFLRAIADSCVEI